MKDSEKKVNTEMEENKVYGIGYTQYSYGRYADEVFGYDNEGSGLAFEGGTHLGKSGLIIDEDSNIKDFLQSFKGINDSIALFDFDGLTVSLFRIERKFEEEMPELELYVADYVTQERQLKTVYTDLEKAKEVCAQLNKESKDTNSDERDYAVIELELG